MIAAMGLETYLHVDARGNRVDPLQLVDRPRGRFEDVDQALVRPDLEVLPRVLVLERGADHAVDVPLGRQRNRTGDARTGALGRLDDLPGSPVDGVVVVRLETDPDLACRYRGQCFVCVARLLAQLRRRPRVGRRPGRMSLNFFGRAES